MKRLIAALFFVSGIAMLVGSCKRDDLSWDLDLTAPIAYGSLSIDDLIADSITSADANGAVRITYHSEVPALNADSLFNIPDTTLDTAYFLPFGSLGLTPGDAIVPNSVSQTTYSLGPAQLTYGILERGKMKVRLKNDIQRRIIVTYVLQSASYNSLAATLTATVPAAPGASQPAYLDTELDLTGYEIDFTGTNGDRVNTMVTSFSAILDPTESPITVFPPDSVGISITFEDIRPSYIRGYFGSEITNIGPEEQYVSFFSRVQSGQIGLDSIYMTFTLENYAGIDARFTVNNLWSRRAITNQTVFLNHSLIGSPVNINRATYSFAYPPSIPQVYSWQFNNSNSNIVDMMEIMPDYFGYDFSLYTNPLGNVSGNNDFLYPRFGINAYLDIDIPVNFYADQLVLADTMETDFGISNAADIQTANLTLYADNGFPFDAQIQIFLLDENQAVVGSIIAAPGTIYSAPLTSSGGYFFSNGMTPTVLQIPMDETQTQRLLNSSHVIVQATFNTNTNPSFVKIFSTNRLDFNLTADFEYRVNN